MRIATAVNTDVANPRIADSLADSVRAKLDNARVDLLCVFASAHFEREIAGIVERLYDQLAPRAMIGVTGEAVICDDLEYEHQPAISIWAASMPAVRISSFHISNEDLERLDSPSAWHDHLAVTPQERPNFILLADPFSINVLSALERFDEAYPRRLAIGGMASAGEQAQQNVIIFDGQSLHEGMVGVGISGALRLDTVVSQGCRPIGRHMVITRAEGQVIHELGGKPPLEIVPQVLDGCTDNDKELARSGGLLVGRVINEHQGKFGRGDFLIRNVVHFDQRTGAMAVNDYFRTGQTIQLHVRDGSSAADDLNDLLAAAPRNTAAGALLFSCNGRGTRLFTHRNHDARALTQACQAPVAGFFCAGEIGPIGGRNCLHGHTASIGFFHAADEPAEG